MSDRLREAAEEALSHLVFGSAGSDLDEHRAVTHAIETLRAALAEKRVPLTEEQARVYKPDQEVLDMMDGPLDRRKRFVPQTCIHCGQPTMHMGNVCFTCGQPDDATMAQEKRDE